MFLGLLVPGLPIAAAAPGEDGAAGEGAAAGMARYHRWMRSQLDAIEADLPRVSLVAERAAMRYATGTWQIAAAGDYGVVGEAVGRSGGIMAMKWGYPFNYLDLDAETNAIVLFALRADQYEKYLREAKAALAGDNVFVIAMGPAPLLERAEADGFPLDAKLPVHAAGTGGLFPGSAPDTWRVATAPVASMALLWTWTAEFVAACTRQGAMPVMHESYAVEGAEARAKERAKRRFEAEAPDPVARGALGRAYLAALRELLGRFDEAERPALKRVVAEARAHRRAGGRLFAFLHGHAIVMQQLDVPHSPGFLEQLNRDWHRQKPDITLREGDFVWCIGYSVRFHDGAYERWDEKAREAGATLAWSFTDYNEAEVEAVRAAGEHFVNQHWAFGDAEVEVPGYPHRICPASGYIAQAVLRLFEAGMFCAER